MMRDELRRDDSSVPIFMLYGDRPDQSEPPFVHIETISARSRALDWRIEPHRHDTLGHILLIRAKGARFLLDEAGQDLRAGAVISIPSKLVHGFQFEPETDGLVLTLSDSLRFLARDGFIETDLAAQLNRALIADLSQDQASLALIENSLLQIEAELAQPRIGQLSAIRSHISLILLTLLRHARFHLAHAPCPSQDLSLVDRLRSLIAEEMTCKHGVPFYAARLRVTQARLTAACHRVAGCSPLHLLHAALLAEAKRGLLYTERPISEIAYSLGFDDPAYFSRFFTTRSGRTPSIFRAQHIKHRPTQGAQP